MILNNLEKK